MDVLQAVFQRFALATEKEFLEEKIEWSSLSIVHIRENNVVDTAS